MVATYELPVRVKLARACYGKSYFARIAGYGARLTLPHIEWRSSQVKGTDGSMGEDWNFEVLAPKIEHIAKSPRHDDWYYWGKVGEWRTNPPRFEGAWLGSVAFEFELDDERIERSPNAIEGWTPIGPALDAMFGEVPGWFERLLIWIGAVGSQDTLFDNPHVRPTTVGAGLAFRAIADDGPSRSAWPRMVNLWRTEAEPVTLGVFRRIVAATNQGRLPPDSHLFLRDARGDLKRDRYRKAVIDAGTAVELVLANWRVTHPASGRDRHGRRPTLGVYVDWTTATLPADTMTGLVHIRNDAIHQGITPTSEQAKRAVEIAIEIVRTYDPLSVVV